MKIFKPRIFPFLILVSAASLLIVSGCSSEESGEQRTDTQLYTCGMHPNVIQEGPGNCPICEMKLTPLQASTGGEGTVSPGSTKSSKSNKILYYRAPMDPSYISSKPGKSPMGMDLVPVYEGEEQYGSTVKINPVVVQNIGIRTHTVRKHDLYLDVRTFGWIDYNESKLAHIHTKFSGWVEKTYVNTTGQKVRKSEPLLEIYSPELVSAQEEYLEALRNYRAGGSSANPKLRNLLESVKKRLEYYDITSEQINDLVETGEIRKTMTIFSPFSGIVVRKEVFDGMEVKPGKMLYLIADLSDVWVYADIYEYEVPWIKQGQTAEISLSYQRDKKYTGTVDYIYPYIEENTRTIKVRIVVSNKDMSLKPGMYTNVVIKARPIENVVAVPVQTVLYSGERNLVFVSLGNGRFIPRDVTIGLEGENGYIEIIDGLEAGEVVVTSGQFLLDSESRLQESIAKMIARKSGNKAMDSDTMNGKSDHSEKASAGKSSTGTEGSSHDHDTPGFATASRDSVEYYTCPMESHAFVKRPEPGECPECGMELVRKTERYDPERTWYTCPMESHSYVVTDIPGRCPVCNMNLVETGLHKQNQ